MGIEGGISKIDSNRQSSLLTGKLEEGAAHRSWLKNYWSKTLRGLSKDQVGMIADELTQRAEAEAEPFAATLEWTKDWWTKERWESSRKPEELPKPGFYWEALPGEDKTLFKHHTLVYSNGKLYHFNSDGYVVGEYDATSGRPGATDYKKRNVGPIPPGWYTINPTEISKMDGLRGLKARLTLSDWGNYRIPLHQDTKRQTYDRDGFFLHGGTKPGSAGCIDVGQNDLALFPLLGKHKGKIKLWVTPYEGGK